MQGHAILQFDQCGAVAQDYYSALLNAIQEKNTHTWCLQPNKPEAAVWMNM